MLHPLDGILRPALPDLQVEIHDHGSSCAPARRTAFFFNPFKQRIALKRFDYTEIFRECWRARKRSIFFCASSRCPFDKCT
jgi:hypothetical protein